MQVVRPLLSVALILLAVSEDAVVTGRVTAPDGRPVAGARVTLIRTDGPSPGASAAARTDKSGVFRLEVPPGEWNMDCRAAGFYEPLPYSAPYPAGHPLPRHLVVRGGEVVSVDLSLKRCSVLAAHIVGVDGAPVARKSCVLVAPRPERTVMERPFRTGGSGAQRISLDYEGSDRLGVRVAGSGYAPLRNVHLQAGKKLDAVFRLRRFASIAGRVSDTEGRAAGGRLVALQGGWPFVNRLRQSWVPVVGRARAAPEVRTNRAGQFRFDQLPVGEYRVSVENARAVAVSLRNGETRTGLLLRLGQLPPTRLR